MSSSALPVDQPFDDQPPRVADITRPKFSTAWRGYDPTDVDAHVRELTQKVEELQRSEARWRKRAERAERQAELFEAPDEHRMIELLGEETARVLDAARQAASDIRHKAEEAAARLISEANDEAHQRRAEGEAEALEQRKRLLAEAEDMRREAADELEKRRAEATETVAEMHREAQAACDSLRQQQEDEFDSAVAEAEALRTAAREDAQRLVAEAQTLRERTLQDLARRRRSAREQLERLNAARERLLAAYEVVRRTVDEATTELNVALPEAKAAGDTAMRRAREEPEPTVGELEAQVTMAKMVGLLDSTDNGAELGYSKHAIEPPPAPPEDDVPSDAVSEADVSGDAVSEANASEANVSRDDVAPDDDAVDVDVVSEDDAADVDVVSEDHGTEDDLPNVDLPDVDVASEDGASEADELAALEHEIAVEAAAEDTSNDTDDTADTDGADEDGELDDLFARLKADTAGTTRDTAGTAEATEPPTPEADGDGMAGVAPDASHEGGDEADDRDHAGEDVASFAASPEDERLMRQRDETVESLERALARRLKRVLADEQNQVLDLVRRRRSPTLDELLTEAEGHADRYADAAVDELQAAAFWGAAAVGGQPGESADALADDLGRAMIEPLRERVSRSLDETDGDLDELTERLRALYREWKGQRVGETVRHYVAAAYARGVFEAAPDDALVRWVVDRSAPVCPDADDNALAGPLPKGEDFPTGHRCPPAHPGCRCLIVPVSIAAGRQGGPRSASVVADR